MAFSKARHLTNLVRTSKPLRFDRQAVRCISFLPSKVCTTGGGEHAIRSLGKLNSRLIPSKLIRGHATAVDSRLAAVLDDIDIFYLRDSCNCPRCVDESTRQKLFETSDIPQNLTYKHHEWLRNGQLQVTWDNDIRGYDDHTSIFDPGFLENSESAAQRRQATHNTWRPVAWSKEQLEDKVDSLTFSYKDYMNSSEALWQAVENLHIYGLIFVRDVPTEGDGVVEGIAQKIGPLKNTFYGMTWNVKSIPSAKNVAYTATNLDFHMDLLYFADPPCVQLLHVKKQSTSGGESRFCDAVAAFERLQNEHPELVRPLVEFPVTYHYKNDGHWLQHTRYFIEGGLTGRSKPSSQKFVYPTDYETINWAPQFQGPMEEADVRSTSIQSTPAFKDYVRAAKKFKDLISDESAVYETKMEEGFCAIFNNRRVLHARKPFSSVGGERWLKGCYVDGDYLRDRYRYMKEERLQGQL